MIIHNRIATRTARNLCDKSRGEKRLGRFSFIGDAHKFLRTARNLCALNFHTASGGRGIRGSLFLFALR